MKKIKTLSFTGNYILLQNNDELDSKFTTQNIKRNRDYT